jgi:hypothetical protein
MCRIVQDVRILWFYFSEQKYFGTINFCWMSQDVGENSGVGLHYFHCTNILNCSNQKHLQSIIYVFTSIFIFPIFYKLT